MKARPWMLIGCAVLVLAPCTALAQKLPYDHGRTQTLPRLKTYAFRENATSDTSDNLSVDERIASAVAAELAARGMTRDEARPDVYVVVRQTFETEKRYTAYNPGYGPYVWNFDTSWNSYGYAWGPGWDAAVVHEKDIVIGTLSIDLVDPATRRLVWRGLDRMTVHPFSKPTHISERINHEVKEIFENLPPIAR